MHYRMALFSGLATSFYRGSSDGDTFIRSLKDQHWSLKATRRQAIGIDRLWKHSGKARFDFSWWTSQGPLGCRIVPENFFLVAWVMHVDWFNQTTQRINRPIRSIWCIPLSWSHCENRPSLGSKRSSWNLALKPSTSWIFRNISSTSSCLDACMFSILKCRSFWSFPWRLSRDLMIRCWGSPRLLPV